MEEKYKKWKGIEREKINWAPVVNAERCKGCGMCVTSCGRNVFDFNTKTKKPIVARPLQCMVGCTSCKVWCIYNAISFPDPEIVRTFICQNNVLKLAKKELIEKYPDLVREQIEREDTNEI